MASETASRAFAGAIALNRFGLGARPADGAPANPEAWLLGQLDRFDAQPDALASAPKSPAMAAELADYFTAYRGGREPASEQSQMAVRKMIRGGYAASVSARMRAAITTDTPFPERLVHFWANHFAVSADKLQTLGLAGTHEFEAIRPNILGRFSDLLLAAVRHPAMLLYLDQAQSIGPDSMIAEAARRMCESTGDARSRAWSRWVVSLQGDK
jgi:uncharacterized protein (DUF1800 family)